MNRGLFQSIARQVIDGSGVSHTTILGLNRKMFTDAGRKVVAIQQNPQTKSHWASLAKQGHKVVQFKDVSTNEYVAVAVDGRVREY